MRRYLLFDLDGTLTDPGEGITNSVACALRHMGVEPPPREQLYPFIGPPLMDSFRDFYGFDGARGEEALRAYRAYFQDRGIFENEVYAGIPETLAQLRRQGFRLLIATSKPEPFAVQIAEHFGLAGYFDDICGSTLAETRTRKAEVIAYALEKNDIRPSEALMLGDRRHDVEGAAECGVPCIGVLWGYGSEQELTDAGAAALAHDPQELPALAAQTE